MIEGLFQPEHLLIVMAMAVFVFVCIRALRR